VFLPYVRNYVDTFIGKSITTSQWRAHLYEYFEKTDRSKIKALDAVNWNVSPQILYILKF
jgi:leukotriene-A4 hydrolase